jgi:hypothetical protein
MSTQANYRAYGSNNKTIKEGIVITPLDGPAKTDDEILEVLELIRSDVGGEVYDEEVTGVEIK